MTVRIGKKMCRKIRHGPALLNVHYNVQQIYILNFSYATII